MFSDRVRVSLEGSHQISIKVTELWEDDAGSDSQLPSSFLKTVSGAQACLIPVSSNDDDYYLYFDNAAPGALPAMSETNVYLWYDDATIDRSGSYTRGRIDAWHGSGWDDSLAWNAAGYYDYDNGDNFTSGYRRAIDERDVYAEAEFYHSGCYQLNITTGMIVRGIIASGTGGSESADHYYASNRGEYPTGCTGGGYSEDGDIVNGIRTTTVVDGANPGDVLANTWRRQGLATWLVNPTNAAYWDENNAAAWAAIGYPDGTNLHVSGTDAPDDEGRGFAGFMTAQDIARVRNILFRRYIDPEPVLVLTLESQPPAIRGVSLVYILAPGALAYLSYYLILLAYQFGGEVAAVTAIRQASIPISVALGGLFLREGAMQRRFFAAGLLALGIVVIALYG